MTHAAFLYLYHCLTVLFDHFQIVTVLFCLTELLENWYPNCRETRLFDTRVAHRIFPSRPRCREWVGEGTAEREEMSTTLEYSCTRGKRGLTLPTILTFYLTLWSPSLFCVIVLCDHHRHHCCVSLYCVITIPVLSYCTVWSRSPSLLCLSVSSDVWSCLSTCLLYDVFNH